MEFNQDIIEDALEKINTSKSNIISNVDNIKKLVGQINSDWKCEASNEFCKNVKNSLNSFDSYIDELKKLETHISASIERFVATEEANRKLFEDSAGGA